MKKIFTKQLFLFGLIMMSALFGYSQQLLVDDFNYSGNLNANGWNVHSGAASNVVATTTGLTYTGLPGSGVGNAALVKNTGGEDINRGFTAQNTNGQTVYVSALVNVTEAGLKTGDYIMHIGNSTAPTTFTLFAGRVYVRTTASGANFSVGNSALVAYGTTNFALNTTYLLIVKYVINTAGNDEAYLWVLPSGVPATEAAAGTPEYSVTTQAGQDIINAVALRQGSATTSAQTVVDALKVGLTWADVTGGSTTPSVSAGPAISNLTTTLGVASAERSYNLSGLNLTPAAGNISVTPGANLEISLTSGGPYTTGSLSVPYTGGTLASTPVYVRIAATAPAGAFTGTVNNSGGGATAVDVSVTGGVATNYYNTKANLGLDNLGTWSSTLDGTGASPANFTDAYAYFNVVNATNTAFNGVFDLTATTSRLVVGDGVAAFNLVVPAGANNITSTTRVDVLNNATLTLQNNTRPFFNNLATGSTVDFAQTGTTTADTIKVPAISYYNLKLTNGLKYFLSGTVTVRGNLTADAVVSMNGALTPFTTINAFGDVTFQNNAAFEPLPSGDAARLTLKMNGPGPNHNLNSNGTDVLIFRLQRDSNTVALTTINTGTNTILTLGNATSGGLLWNGLNSVLNLAANTMNIRGGAVVTNTALGKIDAADATINIVKSAGTTHAGTLRFVTDATLANLNVNLDPAVARDSILIADDVFISGTLTLTKGKVVMAAGKTLSMNAGSAVSGGNLLSFVDGTMAKFGNTDFGFPVGKGSKFAPAAISALSGNGNFIVDYFNSGYGSYTIDPVTLGLYPGYVVSSREYWNINRTNGINAVLTLSYTDATSNIFIPGAIRIAHNDLTDWDDLGGIPNAGNTTTAGFVTSLGPVTNWGPFTFGATSAAVLPVAISSFNVVKQNSTAKISWTTQQETNSREFIVERSANGRNWTAIRTVAAAGNSSTAINYSVIDEAPAKGYNYYRIRMIDLDNKATQTAVKQLYFSAVYSIAVSPNPASDFIKVDVAGNSGKAYTVSVTDAAGRKVYETKSGDAFVNIPAAKFTKGVYVVKVSDEGNILTQKVVLQ